MKTEKWKDIQGYEGIYMISSNGNVKSLPRERITGRNPNLIQRINEKILKTDQDLGGYLNVTLYKDTIGKRHPIHRLVVKHFLGEIPTELCVNHINRIKTDNRVKNLEMCSQRENNSHALIVRKKGSKYIGVSKSKSGRRWRCSIRLGGKRHISYFATEIEAAEAYKLELSKNGIENKYAVC